MNRLNLLTCFCGFLTCVVFAGYAAYHDDAQLAFLAFGTGLVWYMGAALEEGMLKDKCKS